MRRNKKQRNCANCGEPIKHDKYCNACWDELYGNEEPDDPYTAIQKAMEKVRGSGKIKPETMYVHVHNISERILYGVPENGVWLFETKDNKTTKRRIM